MNILGPQRHYSGIFTDTHNWDKFEHRSNDIFICVPPKSGTTWMQSICGLLIFGDPDAKISYPELSPWIEFRLSSKSIDTRLAQLSAQTHRRFIKSHSPLDGVPFFESCTYLIVHRHPLDVHFSMWHHVKNMNLGQIDHLYTDDRAANFTKFLYNSIDNEGLDQPSLESLTLHLKTTRAIAHLPNVHMFHYDTLSSDLNGQMQRVAKALGISHSPKLFEKLAVKATFQNMKLNAVLTAPGVKGGLYKDPSSFFHSGMGRKWEGKLNEEQMAQYDDTMASLLNAEDVRYLETGFQ